MHIAVIGTGYVGLVTGACFAEFGVDVTCVDVDEKKIEALKHGDIPIYEPGLRKIVAKNAAAGRLHFSTEIKSAVEQALVVFLAVGTPPMEDGSPDMSFYRQAAKDVAEAMNGYKVLVTKSTVPVGTGKWLRDFVTEHKSCETNFGVASNPEFLREGAAIEDFMRPDRVVIGSNEEDAIAIMKDLYRPLYLIETPIVITSLEAAELIKYAANAFLATKITFINEIANLCDAIGCDVHDVARGMGMDKRIGNKFLHPGPGYGGSCFPKDTRALTTLQEDHAIGGPKDQGRLPRRWNQLHTRRAHSRQPRGAADHGSGAVLHGLRGRHPLGHIDVVGRPRRGVHSDSFRATHDVPVS